MANVTCECGTIFPLDKVKNMEKCPVCGRPLFGGDTSPDESPKETTKWYYYGEAGGTLTDTLYNPNDFTPLYTFDAVDHEDARRQLKEVFPDSPLLKPVRQDTVRCPRCGSTQIQMVPRKFSLLTGFATNQLDRVCVKCKKRF